VLKIVEYLGKVGGQGHLVLLIALGVAVFFIFIMLVIAFKRAKQAARNVQNQGVLTPEKTVNKVSPKVVQKAGDTSAYIEYLKEALPCVKEEVRQIDTILAGLKGGGGVALPPIDPNPELEREIQKLKKELIAAQAASKEGTVISADPQIEEEIKKLNAENEELKKTSAGLKTKYETAVKGQDDLKTEIEGLKTELSEAKKAGSLAGGDQKQINELNEKISFLESQLAEYEVIEEDIANLKALQEEKQELLKKIADLESGGSGNASKVQEKAEEEDDASGTSVADEFEEESAVSTSAEETSPEQSGIANEFEKFLDADSPS